MEYERIARPDGRNEVWAYEWDLTSKPPAKINRTRLGLEEPPTAAAPSYQAGEAISWSYGRTLGNIATANGNVIRTFPAMSGNDARLACEIIGAGKFQDGRERWWCRTHQKHWGTHADVADAAQTGAIRCAQWAQPMWYVVNPDRIWLDRHAEVGIWCSLPAALTSRGIPSARRPRIHAHVRDQAGGGKVVDRDFHALALMFDPAHQLFGDTPIDRVHVTPPAAMDFVLALEYGKAITCFNCRDCGSPHLDLGEFVNSPHRKHLCGNCGRNNTWTSEPSTSNPLKPLHDWFSRAWDYRDVDRVLNID